MSKTDKREDILEAALEIIAEQGFHGAPMAMIAERASVGAGTIYRYFTGKDELIISLCRDIEEKIKGQILQGYHTDMSIRERFLHLNNGLFRYFIANPLHFRYVEQYHNSPYGVPHRRDKLLAQGADRDVFQELFDDGLSQKVLKDLPLPMLFSLAFGPLISVMRDHILGFITLDDHLIQQITEACWDGLRR